MILFEETLYKTRKDGKYQVMNLVCESFSDQLAEIRITHGIEYGKKQVDVQVVEHGKNVGRANETTPAEQALSETKSRYLRKLDEGYTTKKTAPVFLPMLAKVYEPKRIPAVACVQPKLDGIRAFVNGRRLLTRKRKDMSYLFSEWLTGFPEDTNIFIDGELYSTSLSFQEMAGALRTNTVDDRHDKIFFIVYDLFDASRPGLSYLDRFVTNPLLKQLNDQGVITTLDLYAGDLFHIVSNPSHEFISSACSAAMEAGFEGVMVRDVERPYLAGKRSDGLLKCKVFLDSEFECVDVIAPITGREEGTAIFVCRTESGTTFNAPSCGTREYRRDLFNDRLAIIGKMITVKYQELTDGGTPRFPKGVAIRDYE
jgi:DNA ligase-1